MKTMLALTGLAAAMLAGPAAAMDCGKEFRVRIEKMMSDPSRPQSLSEAVMVDRTRFALQGFDACMKGDMKSARSFFDKAGGAGH